MPADKKGPLGGRVQFNLVKNRMDDPVGQDMLYSWGSFITDTGTCPESISRTAGVSKSVSSSTGSLVSSHGKSYRFFQISFSAFCSGRQSVLFLSGYKKQGN